MKRILIAILIVFITLNTYTITYVNAVEPVTAVVVGYTLAEEILLYLGVSIVGAETGKFVREKQEKIMSIFSKVKDQLVALEEKAFKSNDKKVEISDELWEEMRKITQENFSVGDNKIYLNEDNSTENEIVNFTIFSKLDADDFDHIEATGYIENLDKIQSILKNYGYKLQGHQLLNTNTGLIESDSYFQDNTPYKIRLCAEYNDSWTLYYNEIQYPVSADLYLRFFVDYDWYDEENWGTNMPVRIGNIKVTNINDTKIITSIKPNVVEKISLDYKGTNKLNDEDIDIKNGDDRIIYLNNQSIPQPDYNVPDNIEIDWSPLLGLGKIIVKKFPFCIPYDLLKSIEALNSDKAAPKWTIKFDKKYFPGGGEFEINFGIFEELAVIVRWGIAIAFNGSLIVLTKRMIN